MMRVLCYHARGRHHVSVTQGRLCRNVYGSPLGTCRLSCCRTSSLVLSPLVVSYCRVVAFVLSPCRPSWYGVVALLVSCYRLRGVVLSPWCCRIVAVNFLRVPCIILMHTLISVASINTLLKSHSLKCSVGLYQYNRMSWYVSMSICSYLFIYLFTYLLIIVGLFQLKFFIAKYLCEIKNLPSAKIW